MYGTETSSQHRPGLTHKTAVNRPKKQREATVVVPEEQADNAEPEAGPSTVVVTPHVVQFPLTAQTAKNVTRIVTCGECLKPRVSFNNCVSSLV